MATATPTTAVKSSDATTLITRCMGVQRPVFLWGPPGIGKSELVEGIGNQTNRPVIDLRLLLMEPTDIKGIPYYCPESNTMRWAKPSELPGEGEVELANAILFLDEMNAAPQSVQAAAYQLILNRRVGEYHLPKGVDIIAAGNRETDKGVTFRMPSPLANRFVHLELKVDFDDWQKWAVNKGVHPEVVGFLTHKKQHLFTFNPKSPDKAFATPRSWVFVSDLITDDLPDYLNRDLVAGTVGEGMAIEFMEHRRVAAKMPLPEDVLDGKVKKLDVDEISAKYSLTIGLCYTMKELAGAAEDTEIKKYSIDDWHKQVDNFFRFMLDNFEAEMNILGAKTAMRDYELPIETRKLKNFKEFYQKFGKFVLDD